MAGFGESVGRVVWGDWKKLNSSLLNQKLPSVNLFFIIFDPTLQRFEKANLAFARVLPENRSPSWFSWFSSVRGEFPEVPYGADFHRYPFVSLRRFGILI